METQPRPNLPATPDHLIGEDGFVVPRNVHELYQYDPDWVTRICVILLSKKSRDEEKIQVLTQDMWMHLASLPERQDSRDAWLAKGVTDKVGMFDPERLGGKVTAGLFFTFLKKVIYNRYLFMYSPNNRHGKQPLDQPSNFSIVDTGFEDGPLTRGTTSPEQIEGSRIQLFGTIPLGADRRIYLKEFLEFVQKHDQRVYEFLLEWMECEVKDQCTSFTEKERGKLIDRVKQLALVFTGKMKVYKPRREYKPRASNPITPVVKIVKTEEERRLSAEATRERCRALGKSLKGTKRGPYKSHTLKTAVSTP